MLGQYVNKVTCLRVKAIVLNVEMVGISLKGRGIGAPHTGTT